MEQLEAVFKLFSQNPKQLLSLTFQQCISHKINFPFPDLWLNITDVKQLLTRMDVSLCCNQSTCMYKYVWTKVPERYKPLMQIIVQICELGFSSFHSHFPCNIDILSLDTCWIHVKTEVNRNYKEVIHKVRKQNIFGNGQLWPIVRKSELLWFGFIN